MLKVGTKITAKALDESFKGVFYYRTGCIGSTHGKYHMVQIYATGPWSAFMIKLTKEEILRDYFITEPEEILQEPEEAGPTFTLKQIKEAYNNYNANGMDGWNEPEDMFEGFFKLLENSVDPDYEQYLALKAKFE